MSSSNTAYGGLHTLVMEPPQGGGSYPYKAWQYYGTFKYSQKFLHVTESAIVAAITPFIPWASAAVALNVASIYHTAYADNAYITEVVYRYWEFFKNNSQELLAEKTYYNFYSDSARHHLLKTLSHTYYK
ncbi:hypothetical protein [Sporolactobacillus pectinivorans]|uniref:hypothetical protein n=1 Tax=Sporolactobacillus pectinivorans TaxID=1591408 RepID=UPI0013902E52|nr:hypothetical protein [Sporolactobacillus pectinivorans]